jgi:hypothetical protein
MIVLIPTYKRTQILNWVIESVVKCDIDGIDERVLIVIVNNHYPSKESVEAIVAQFDFVNNFECRCIHRENTLPMTESWFSGISEMAYEDEVVVLLGDDDIMLPWGLKNRFNQIEEQQADILLSDFYQRIYFFQDGKKYWLDDEMPRSPIEEVTAVPWEYSQPKHQNLTFMSNHCYRNTAAFRDGVSTAMSWAKAQDFAPIEYATGNLPFYLAFAIKDSGGIVVELDEKCVLRGSIADDGINNEYADGGNTAFYNLLVYNTFEKASQRLVTQKNKDALCSFVLSNFKSAFISILFNKNIPLRVLLKTMQQSDLRLKNLISTDFLRNYHSLLRLIPWFRGYRLKRIAKLNSLKNSSELTTELLEL